MRTPIRKPGKYTKSDVDINLTAAKFIALGKELEKLIKVSRPQAIEETKRLAALGDFSENAEYQLAKGRLRGMNQRILDLETLLPRANIIDQGKARSEVTLGAKVTVEFAGKEKVYQILGSAETDPTAGVISQNSPLGAALIGRRVGDSVKIELKDKTNSYKIIRIE